MWPNTQVPADLVTLTEEIIHVKLNYLRSVMQSFFEIFSRNLF